MSNSEISKEQMNQLISVLTRIADALSPIAVPYKTSSGGNIGSITEGLIGCTEGLNDIAKKIESLEDSIEEKLIDIEAGIIDGNDIAKEKR